MLPAVVLSVSLSLLPQSHEGTCSPELDQALSRLEEALFRIEADLDDVGARAVRKRLRRKLVDAKRAARHVRDEACPEVVLPPPPPPEVAPPPPPPPVALPPMDPATFRALVAAVQAESFSEGKLSVLETGVEGSCLLAEQGRSLLGLLSFSGDRLKAARLVAPRIVDRQNAFRLYEAFSFEKDKKALQQILREAPVVAACASP